MSAAQMKSAWGSLLGIGGRVRFCEKDLWRSDSVRGRKQQYNHNGFIQI